MGRIIYLILFLFICQIGKSIDLPAGLNNKSNIILWLSPDTAVYRNNNGAIASDGQTVRQWHDISGNGFVFRNNRNKNRPSLTTVSNKKYLDFSAGDMLFNSAIKDTLNGLEEFSIFIVIKSDVQNTDNGFMYWKYPPDGEDDGLCLRYDANGANTGNTNNLKIGFQGNSSQYQIETQSNTQSTNRQVLTITWKKGEKIRSFINGVENNSSPGILDSPLSGIEEILLGKGAKDETTSEGWDGKIGTVIFYNTQYNEDTVDIISGDLSTINSIQSGNWNSPSTWDCDCVPTPSSTVKINDTHAVTLDGDATAFRLYLNNGSTFYGETNTLTLTSHYYGYNGSKSYLQDATIKFVGDQYRFFRAFQTNFTLNNLDIQSGGLTLNTSGLNITGYVNINNANLITNDKLTLKSNANTHEAHIKELTNGAQITGNVTVERYIYSDHRIWRYLSSPIQGTTALDWNDDFPITGKFEDPDSSDVILKLSPSLYVYDEKKSGNLDNGWSTYPKTGLLSNTPIEVGKGYAAFIRDNLDRPDRIDMTGIPVTGNITVNLSYSNTGNESDGWNLVGNPYPSAIDWDKISSSQKNNIANAIYYTDNSSGTSIYRSYVNGIGNPASTTGSIALCQAFWVKATDSNPSITFEEEDKLGASGTYFKTAAPEGILRIRVENSETWDETVISINEDATFNFDRLYDAIKFVNEDLSIFTTSGDNQKLSINSFSIVNEINIPLTINNTTGKSTILTFSELSSFDDNYVFVLKNNKTGEETEIDYNTNLEIHKNHDTYSLIIKKQQDDEETDIWESGSTGTITLYPNPVTGNELYLKYDDHITNATIILADQLGHTYTSHVEETDDNEMAVDVSMLKAGLYILHIKSGDYQYKLQFIKQ